MRRETKTGVTTWRPHSHMRPDVCWPAMHDRDMVHDQSFAIDS